MPFQAFTPVHLAILAAVPLAAGLLALVTRRSPRAVSATRAALAAAIAVDELAFYGWSAAHGWLAPPQGLPLDLCDVVVWLAVYALLTSRPWALDAVYYLGLAGSGMALLTPDVGAAFPSYPGVKFFASHGAVVAAVLWLVFVGELRPRRGSWWRVFLGVNAYAAAVALFNARYGTNYMYLRQKPESRTLLDVLGPWPWYVLGGEAVALLLLGLLYLPFARPGAWRGAREA